MPRAAWRTGFTLCIALLVVLSLSGKTPWAGGAFSFEDTLLPVLSQKPALAKWLTDTLDFDEQGLALRLPSGERTAPFVILARPKGSQGPFIFEVRVEGDPLRVSIRESRNLDDVDF